MAIPHGRRRSVSVAKTPSGPFLAWRTEPGGPGHALAYRDLL